MYIFGYILVHAPVEWTIGISTSFDMLVSSLADHACPDSKILGSIKQLNLHFVDKDNMVSHLEDFPMSLLQIVTGIEMLVTNHFIPMLIKDMATLCNFQSISLNLQEISPKDHDLYRALQSASKLKRFELIFFDMFDQGVHELSKTISSSSCLKFVTIKKKWRRGTCTQNNFCELTNATLSCSTLTKLCLSLPIHYFNTDVSTIVEDVEFSFRLNYCTLTVKFFDFLFCIADVCKATHLKSLKLDVFMPVLLFYPLYIANFYQF